MLKVRGPERFSLLVEEDVELRIEDESVDLEPESVDVEDVEGAMEVEVNLFEAGVGFSGGTLALLDPDDLETGTGVPFLVGFGFEVPLVLLLSSATTRAEVTRVGAGAP